MGSVERCSLRGTTLGIGEFMGGLGQLWRLQLKEEVGESVWSVKDVGECFPPPTWSSIKGGAWSEPSGNKLLTGVGGLNGWMEFLVNSFVKL